MDRFAWRILLVVGCAWPTGLGVGFAADAGPRRLHVFTNQLGYHPGSAKWCVVEDSSGRLADWFAVMNVDRATQATVFSGRLRRVEGDFGAYFVGDFSSLTVEGRYLVAVSGGTTSHPFRVACRVYDDAISKGVGCFAVQRCGPSKTGYHAPCHLDDGIRMDNGKPIDVVGGWHDASDLLKWVDATLTGMYALLNVARLTDDRQLRLRILEEVQWGNRYFLAMQSPDGYVYSYGIGGDPVEEGNHWTDNVRGTADDRRVAVNVGDVSLQHQFIAAQAMVASVFARDDGAYAGRCLEAAKRCFAWVKDKKPTHHFDLGSGIYAGVQLHRAAAGNEYKAYALRMAQGYLGLQQRQYVRNQQQVRGYFYADESRSCGAEIIHTQPLALIGLCELAQAYPTDPVALRWREAIRLHCEDCLMAIGLRNAFGIVPYVVEPPPKLVPGARKVGELGYRYFMGPRNGNWFVGNVATVAGAGVALVKAAAVLQRPELARLAQRQLDWVLGANPFGVSFMVGVGHVNPPEYIFTGFQPRTPRIPGAVMCGMTGDENDAPDLLPGSYHSCEYWTPMLAHVIWLMAELQAPAAASD